ncbi:DUF4199 domain-containing protein [Mongoliitalea lutea]|uniref:DUF4199 domain-containing protein n=1 Tax=Mongoliitalea lutea TaxID=849756 RepID=A0A8J3CYZ4_9BACT|nr:DUF4199 domain-containing protein [Mongoliitalea lutea]GHB40871.1 hypothetical protein GCM10008106_22490 [Mongoliitalea lutea]
MEEKLTIGDVVKKWGLIYGLLGLIVAILSIIFELHTLGTTATVVSSVLNISIAFSIYFLATKEFRTGNNDFLEFGQGFKIVALIGLLGGVIRAVGYYVYITIIDTGFLDWYTEQQLDAQEKAGVDIDNLPEFVSFLMSPEFLALATVFGAIFGFLILGLIAASINKKTEDY